MVKSDLLGGVSDALSGAMTIGRENASRADAQSGDKKHSFKIRGLLAHGAADSIASLAHIRLEAVQLQVAANEALILADEIVA